MSPRTARIEGKTSEAATAASGGAERLEPDARFVKDALRRRHSAEQYMGSRLIQGAWTCIEEYRGIDLLAFSAHSSPASGKVEGVNYPRVGYEVKISRSDYRRELLQPDKRMRNVEWCNAFYFAVPRGLLTADEIAFEEPEVGFDAFAREACQEPGCRKGKVEALLVGPLPKWRGEWRPLVDYRCTNCGGRGWTARSLVEREWPTLWVPRDVGLIEVDGRGCRVTRRSPVRKDVPGIDAGFHLADLIRWVSVRPDPRHVHLAERRALATTTDAERLSPDSKASE